MANLDEREEREANLDDVEAHGILDKEEESNVDASSEESDVEAHQLADRPIED